MEENDHIVVIQFGIKCNDQTFFIFFIRYTIEITEIKEGRTNK
jgi:hypothetical protein